MLSKAQFHRSLAAADGKISNPKEATPNQFLSTRTAQAFIAEHNRQMQQRQHNDERDDTAGLFVLKSANDWMAQAKRRPAPAMLFSELWHEGELCILFADTNLGKSILAVQIADSLTTGIPIAGFKLNSAAQLVLYYDFELFDKQFEHRYSSNYSEHYTFHNNLIRVEMDAATPPPESMTFEDYLNHSLELSIVRTGARVLIIDNITYLRHETEQAKDALPLMKQLKALKNTYGLSILALAHTPKRDLSKPITRNDLQGSKMLINFADSAFAIGESCSDSSIRYLKQIKARNTEMIYDGDNVCLCHIEKPGNFLKFTLIGKSKEAEHLRERNDSERSELEDSVSVLMQSTPGITAYTIPKQLCKNDNEFEKMRIKIARIMRRIGGN